MVRFNVRTLMHYTAMAAAFLVLLRGGLGGHDWQAFIGFAALATLAIRGLYVQYNADMAITKKRIEQETPAE